MGSREHERDRCREEASRDGKPILAAEDQRDGDGHQSKLERTADDDSTRRASRWSCRALSLFPLAVAPCPRGEAGDEYREYEERGNRKHQDAFGSGDSNESSERERTGEHRPEQDSVAA